MYNHVLYFGYWLATSVSLYIFASIFPDSVVLGNWRFGMVESAFYAGFWVTFFIWCFWDFAIAKGLQFETPLVSLGYFWSVNLFSVWLVARFSQYSGLGISDHIWAVVVGLGAHSLQRLVRKIVVSRSKD